MDLGISRVLAILDVLGNPQDSLNVIHVAGTNGKGSICSFIESILMESFHAPTNEEYLCDKKTTKLKVGKFSSPHLLSVEDSLRINKTSITEKDLHRIRGMVYSVASENGISLTNFEALTVTMFLWFKECHIDVAVVEVGLGGALDATNVLENPLACVFSSIGLDHEALLGTTIPEIAVHKAGILKVNGNAVISQQTEVSALKSLVLQCEKNNIFFVSSDAAHIKGIADFPSRSVLVEYTTKTLKTLYIVECFLQGDFQMSNLACALDVIDLLKVKYTNLFSIPVEAVSIGVSNTSWPGRLQWIEAPGLGQILVDGAHNPAAARALANYLEKVIGARLTKIQSPLNIHWVFGATEGKCFDQIISILIKGVNGIANNRVKNHLSLVGFSQPAEMPWVQSCSTNTLHSKISVLPDIQLENTFQCEAISGALGFLKGKIPDPNDLRHLVIVTGSLYLVADLFRLLDMKV